jgi:two-component system, sensor histidine kinase and response regulator
LPERDTRSAPTSAVRDRPAGLEVPPPMAGPSAATRVDGDDWLHAVPGLDSADGLRRVLGNRAAFVALLRRFASSQADAAREIRTACADDRVADAERYAHTLKGVAGSIGARELQREAGELEAALRRRDPGGIVEPLLERTAQVLDRLVVALVRALPPELSVPEPTAAVDAQALAATVQRLEVLLSQDAVEALDAFDACRPLLTAAYGARASEIGRLVKGYRFEEALTALRAAAREDT